MAEPDYLTCAKAAIAGLQRWYDPASGLWRGTGWWNSANALTAVIRYTKLTGDTGHAGVIPATFAAAGRHAQFINDYYDDNSWWALAWVTAYDVTRDGRYLDAARTIFARNAAGWDDMCRGGLRWHMASSYKNAITSELFLTLAALLHQRVPRDQSYLAWAQRSWDWFAASGLIGPGGLVNDGLTPACQNNGGTTWTYNQGVILGGLAALSEITGDRAYLDQGRPIAAAALSQLTSHGILAEPCEAAPAGCDADQAQFKGIFVRYLYDFWRQARDPVYRAFILANAGSVWQKSRNAAHQLGLRWAGPFDRADPARQSSALDALIAAAALTA